MNDFNKPIKAFFKKVFKIIVMFLVVFVISLFTKLPAYFDSYVFHENFKFIAWICLILYRLVIYFSFPFILYWRSKIKNKLKGKKNFVKEITENFNAQFVGYSIISAIYVLFGVDKFLGVEIFGSADAFLFITGFVVSVIINKSIPNLMPDD